MWDFGPFRHFSPRQLVDRVDKALLMTSMKQKLTAEHQFAHQKKWDNSKVFEVGETDGNFGICSRKIGSGEIAARKIAAE